MNTEIKTKWLEALRSGKYQQGRGILRSVNNEYCCLGVLCDLVAPDKWTKPEKGTAMFFMSNNGDKKLHFPPDSVMRAAELSIDNGDILAARNDDGQSFEEIANFIEENL